jgi:hypothetical protein
MHLLNEQNARHVARGGLTIPDLKGYYTSSDDRGFGSGARRAVGISAELAEARSEQADAEDELREAKQSGDAEAIQQAEEAVDAAKANVDKILAKGDAYLESLRESIEKQLTDYERDWIAATQELMDGYSKDRLNETTLEVYGIKKARVENYYPIKSDKNFTRGDFEAVARNMSLENVGFMKERVEGTNPMYLMDVADVVNTRISNVAQYCGLMPAIRSFNKIWNKSEAGNTVSLKDTVNQKFGQGGLKYVENLIADLQGARRGKSDGLSRFLSGMRGNMAGANLTISLNTALAQAASYPTAAAEIGWTPLIKAFFKGEPFELNNPNKREIVQAMLLYLNSLGDPVFHKEGKPFEAENNLSNVDYWGVVYWFNKEIEIEREEQSAPDDEFCIYDYGFEIYEENMEV